MIRITNIRNAVYSEYDEVWAIVRSMKSPNPHIKQVQALSPSTQLFFKYLDLKKANDWNETSFSNIYVPTFLKELERNDDAKRALAYLCEQDAKDKKICLVCFCTDEKLCHRSIIAGILINNNCHVVTDCDKELYKKYNLQF